MMRIVLFLITNLSVMILFGSLMNLLGFRYENVFFLMMIAGFLGFGGSFLSLLLSKSIALSAVNGLIVDQASNDMEHWLLKMIDFQSNKLGILPPQLAIYDSVDMNAFATGMSKNSALVAVSTGLLKNMNKESVEAVIAHELTHISAGDMVTMTLIQGILNTFVIFLSRNIAQLVSCWNLNSSIHDDCDDHGSDNYSDNSISSNSLTYVVVSSILEFLFGIIASIIVFWFSRYREFYADAGAAKLVGIMKMIAALQELKVSFDNSNNTLLDVESNLKTLYINNSAIQKNSFFNLLRLNDLFSSHPSLDKRIEALRKGIYLTK